MTMADLVTQYQRAAQKVDAETQRQLRAIALVGAGLMKQSIQKYHAVDTSTMLNSVRPEPVGKTAYEIGTPVHYASYVAEGTSRVPARPFHKDSAAALVRQVKMSGLASKIGLE